MWISQKVSGKMIYYLFALAAFFSKGIQYVIFGLVNNLPWK